MQSKITYYFSAKLWKYDAPGGWHFVSLPTNISKEIRKHLGWQEEGWGRLKVTVQIGELQWHTALWFDTKRGVYLLPIKAVIRKKAQLQMDDTIEMRIWL